MNEMTVMIGRAGIDPVLTNAGTAKHSDGSMTITGVHRSGSLDEHTAARNQLQGLADNVDEPIVPVVITGIPAGFWRVDRVDWDERPGALDDDILHAEWSVSLSPVDARATGMWESRLMMLPDQGGSPPLASPWTAIPNQASGWEVLTGSGQLAVHDRPSKSGGMVIIEGGRLGNARTQWHCEPVDAYQGAATILSGESGVIAGRPAHPDSVTFTTGGTHTWTVPSGVNRVWVSAAGGTGGSVNQRVGGRGALVTGTLDVTPGETLTIHVGGRGGNGRAVGTNLGSPTVKNVDGGAGGTNGGARGGAGSATSLNSFAMSGAGGGGSSDVRRGGTGLSDRVVVAAGGGGASASTGGSATGVNGGSGAPAGPGGQGASTTAAGIGGFFGEVAGGDGQLGAGGIGATRYSGGGNNYSGGGGGGAGLYGGGGGAALLHQHSAGAGGAGSSLVPPGGRVRVSPAGTSSRVAIGPLSDSGVGEPVPGISYWPVVGRNIPADPWGWQLNNGVIRVRPTFSDSEIGWSVDTWTGQQWSQPQRFGLKKEAGGVPTSASSTATTVTVLRNAVEAVAVRLGYSDASRVGVHTVDMTLRRGARHVDLIIRSSDQEADWILVPDPDGSGVAVKENASGSNDYYLRASTAGASGERWVAVKYRAKSGEVHTNGQIDLGSAPVHAGFGFVRSGESHLQVAIQFNARGSETVRYVTT